MHRTKDTLLEPSVTEMNKLLSHVPYSAALRTGRPWSECLATILEPSLTTYMKTWLSSTMHRTV